MMVTVPKLLQTLYPSLIWHGEEKALYLTFDDGPHPVITPKVLNLLDQYGAKATFFCVGDNVRKYPEIYREILQRGHATGNHTYNHLNGWKTETETYVANVKKAAGLIHSNLMRPPYGKIKRSQIKQLKQDYKLVMWSVLTYDFSSKITPAQCYRNALKGLKNGSILVFHDSDKAAKNMLYALPKFLEKGSEEGLGFSNL